MLFNTLSWCSLMLILHILNVLDALWCSFLMFFDALWFSFLRLFGALDVLALLKRCPSHWKAGCEERSGLTRLRQNLVQIKLFLQIIKNLSCKDTQTSMEGFDLPLKVSTEASVCLRCRVGFVRLVQGLGHW